MLASLAIRNYALISSLDVDFRDGLNMITGETGAGKSILLGALSLLLGNRADTQVLKEKDQKCLVEAVFDLDGLDLQELFESSDLDYDNRTVIRREITPQGKSRAFINDTPVNLNVMKDIGGRLVDIHSQHQNLIINDPGYALHVIDAFGRLGSQVGEFNAAHEKFREIEREIHHLTEELNRARAEQEYLEFQFAQLEQAALSEDEQESHQLEQELLEHAEEIQVKMSGTVNELHESDQAILSRLKQVIGDLHSIAGFYREVQPNIDRLQESYIELQDITRDLEGLLDHVEPNPGRLQWINDRLDLIYSLEKKHQVNSIRELMELKNQFQSRLQAIQTSDEAINSLQATHKVLLAELTAKATALTEARKKVLPGFEELVSSLLKELGMPHGRFEVHQNPTDSFTPEGRDEVRFYFAANKNQVPEEISRVASGGEISRLMLSVKYLISDSLAIPTVIFDEIDAGVSGDIADKLGTLISKVATGRQVLNITHLPQVASKGDHHYLVYKYDDEKTTHTAIRLLSAEDRVLELAKMLSGENITPEAVQNARVLLSSRK